MKKILMVAAAAAAAALSAVPASAQTAGTNLTINLNAQVGSVCGAYRAGGQVVAINFGELASVATTATVTPASQGSVTYRCNSPVGFTRTISSANGGFLSRNNAPNPTAENHIPFFFAHGGGSGLGIPSQQLTAAVITNLNASSAFLAGQTGGLTFSINGVQAAVGGNDAPGTTVFAGTYQDTVTIAITAN